jgi:hypothetical protein
LNRPLSAAAYAVRHAFTLGGWGYNLSTGPDADSTAWAIRFLATSADGIGSDAMQCLAAYVDAHGRAHTFLEPDAGTWGAAHADVTPVAGLALLAAGAPTALITRVRRAVEQPCLTGRSWHSFWWSTDDYANAWSVEFLARSGGLSAAVTRVAREIAAAGGEPRDAFEAAHRLLLLLRLGASFNDRADRMVDCLLDFAGPTGMWPPSAQLLVPDKRDGRSSIAFADVNGILSTAIACTALARWLMRD